MRRLTVTIIWLLMIVMVSAEDRISLRVKPAVQFAPGYLRISIVVPRNADNRQVCLVVDSENFFRSSCFEHVGEGARYETVVEYKDVPAGHYAVGAELVYTVNGERKTAYPRVVEVRVRGIGDDPDPEP